MKRQGPPGNQKQEHWRNHPLVQFLRRVRQAHRVSQESLAIRMGIADQSIKAIEAGRQNLPHLVDRDGEDLSTWLHAWMRAVEATEAEREELQQLLQDIVLASFHKDE